MAADRTVVLAGARGDRVAVTGAVIGPPDTPGEVVELGDATVIPGLVDAHVHFPSWALGLRELNLFGTPSVGEALERIEAAEKPTDGFLRGRGWREEDWPEGERPALAALDEVTGEVPTALRAHDGHTLLGQQRSVPSEGGAGVRPTRILRASSARTRRPGTSLTRSRRLRRRRPSTRSGRDPCRARRGVTGVHDKDGARGAPEAFATLRDAGELTLRVWQSVPDADADRGSYVKVFMDGTLGSRTALLLGGGGMRLMGPDELADVVRGAAAAGMPVAVHAIGDLANREALDGFEATEDVWRPLGLRHRVEHAQCVHPDDVVRYARLGITASVQYSHATSDRELAARLWADRLDRAYPYRQLLDAGVRLAGGSDAPVEALDPLAGIAAARSAASAARRRSSRSPPRPPGSRARRTAAAGCHRASDADLVDPRRRPRARDDGRRRVGPRSAARVVGVAQPALELGVAIDGRSGQLADHVLGLHASKAAAIPSAVAPTRSRSARTSAASSVCTPDSDEADTDTSCERTVSSSTRIRSISAKKRSSCFSIRRSVVSWVSSASSSSGSPPRAAHLRQPRLDAVGRRVGQRLVEQLRPPRGRVHRRHEAVDLLRHLLVGKIRALDRVADPLLAHPRLAQQPRDRRREVLRA